jgi:hypothetical protein
MKLLNIAGLEMRTMYLAFNGTNITIGKPLYCFCWSLPVECPVEMPRIVTDNIDNIDLVARNLHPIQSDEFQYSR